MILCNVTHPDSVTRTLQHSPKIFQPQSNRDQETTSVSWPLLQWPEKTRTIFSLKTPALSFSENNENIYLEERMLGWAGEGAGGAPLSSILCLLSSADTALLCPSWCEAGEITTTRRTQTTQYHNISCFKSGQQRSAASLPPHQSAPPAQPGDSGSLEESEHERDKVDLKSDNTDITDNVSKPIDLC